MSAMELFGEGETAVQRVTLVRLSAFVARSLASAGRFAVEGEVVRPTSHPGGVYFTLKDRAAQLSVRCPANRLVRCRTVAGERVLVTGTLTWLSDRGQVQLVAEEVVPVGAGAVAALLAETRERLAAAGLLERPRRSIPRLPAVIGVVCGRDAAVRADIEAVVADRFPGYPVLFEETNVSGPGAAQAITEALRALDALPAVDVIILARGGGDAPQLLPFSDEGLCRAICATRVPVVSAIGHDGDRPLCDEVADRRAGTPSLAASAVVPSRAELEAELRALAGARRAAFARCAERATARLSATRPRGALAAGLDVARGRLDRGAGRLVLVHPARRLPAATARLAAGRLHLDALSPARVLDRGYAIARTVDGHVLRDAAGVPPGTALRVEVARGVLVATVDQVERAGDDPSSRS